METEEGQGMSLLLDTGRRLKPLLLAELAGMYCLVNSKQVVMFRHAPLEVPLLPLHDDMSELLVWARLRGVPCTDVLQILDPESWARVVLKNLASRTGVAEVRLMLKPRVMDHRQDVFEIQLIDEAWVQEVSSAKNMS